MSTQGYDDLDDEDDDSAEPASVKQLRQHVKKLEKELAASKEGSAKAEQLERRLAFIEAGIDPKDPKASYFVKGYEGELTAEAIKAEATTIGLLQPNTVPDSEVDAHDRMAATANGSVDGKVSQEEFVSQIGAAKSAEEVIALAQKGGMQLAE